MYIFQHPEAEEGEIFLTNSNQKAFEEISWSTKRKGLVALDSNGLMTSNTDWFPVFIGKKELYDSGRDIKDVRREIRDIISGIVLVLK